MENREAISKDGSLYDRKVISDEIKNNFIALKLQQIKELEKEIFYNAEQVGILKARGLSYQKYENECNLLNVRMGNLTRQVLEKYYKYPNQ
jgi:hypothetical protein